MTDEPTHSATPLVEPPRRATGGAFARVLIILAAVFLPLGLTLPVLETTRLWVFKDSYSLIDTVRGLFDSGEVALAILIALFSLITPAIKLVVVSTLHLSGQSGATALTRWAERLGKWSLTDVLVVAVLIVVWSGTGLQLTTQPGLWFFAASSAMLMLASGLVVNRHLHASPTTLQNEVQNGGAENRLSDGRSDRI